MSDAEQAGYNRRLREQQEAEGQAADHEAKPGAEADPVTGQQDRLTTVDVPADLLPEGVGPAQYDPEMLEAAGRAYNRGLVHTMEVKSYVILDLLRRARVLPQQGEPGDAEAALAELVRLWELKQANPAAYEMQAEAKRLAWYRAREIVRAAREPKP